MIYLLRGCGDREMTDLSALTRRRQHKPPPPPPRAPGTPRHITIIDLQANDCRWIMNDDTSRAEYCGLPCCVNSAVYCADHHRMAYVRPPASRNSFRHFRP